MTSRAIWPLVFALLGACGRIRQHLPQRRLHRRRQHDAPTTDIDGETRPMPSGTMPDLGPDELP